jgi:Enoyl-CoA hydratase/isomerase
VIDRSRPAICGPVGAPACPPVPAGRARQLLGRRFGVASRNRRGRRLPDRPAGTKGVGKQPGRPREATRPDTVDPLGVLIGRIENDSDLTVVVFGSDTPGYFMAHWDFLADNARVAVMPPGPTGLHPYADNFVRLSRAPVATVSEIRGRTRGAGSEFVLATDLRFASGKAVLGQFEVGVGAEFAPGLDAYFAAAGRPENQPFSQLLLEHGLRQPDGIETDLGTSLPTQPKAGCRVDPAPDGRVASARPRGPWPPWGRRSRDGGGAAVAASGTQHDVVDVVRSRRGTRRTGSFVVNLDVPCG